MIARRGEKMMLCWAVLAAKGLEYEEGGHVRAYSLILYISQKRRRACSCVYQALLAISYSNYFRVPIHLISYAQAVRVTFPCILPAVLDPKNLKTTNAKLRSTKWS